MPPSADYSEQPSWAAGDVVGEFFDPASGRLFVVARPADQPELWQAYIDGAWLSYRQHGVERAVDYDRVRDGKTTSLFYSAIDFDGRVVGGLRVQGPYTHVEQAYALREWAGRAGSENVRRQIAGRLHDGVIEIKAVWVDRDARRHNELTAALARIFVHSLMLLDVRYAFCTAASHALPRWQSSGGVVSADVGTVAYPDERYQTWLIWWDRQNAFRLMAPEQVAAIVRESDQLLRRSMVEPAGSPSVA